MIMSPGRIRLASGVSADQAAAVLREVIGRAGSIYVNALRSDDLVRTLQEYFGWVEQAEAQLIHLSSDEEVVARLLHSERYWHIRRLLFQSDLRPVPLINAEIASQLRGLTRIVDDLEDLRQRVTRAPGRIAVVDSNVLLHYQEPDKIPWEAVLGLDRTRLVIPLRVLEELDSKKFSVSPKLRERARAVLPMIERLVGRDGFPGTLRDGVTIEVLVEPGPRQRPADADAEILTLCAELPQFGADDPVLVTGDTAMRLRAQAQGTRTAKLPENYLRIPPENSTAG